VSAFKAKGIVTAATTYDGGKAGTKIAQFAGVCKWIYRVLDNNMFRLCNRSICTRYFLFIKIIKVSFKACKALADFPIKSTQYFIARNQVQRTPKSEYLKEWSFLPSTLFSQQYQEKSLIWSRTHSSSYSLYWDKSLYKMQRHFYLFILLSLYSIIPYLLS